MVFDQTSVMQNIISLLPETIVILSLLLVFIIDLIKPNSIWLVKIAFTGLLIATIGLLYQWINPITNNFLVSYEVNGFTIPFRTILTLSSSFCILISEEYIKRSGVALAEFLIFILTATIGAMFLCGANDLITIFVSLECLSLSSYLLAGYTKQDVRSNEAAMKYLLIGSASSGILAYGFSWLYGLSGGHIGLYELFTGINNHLSDSLAIWIAFTCILVGLAFKISAVPFHQWTPDVYEGSPTPVVAFFSVSSKTASIALATRMLSIVFPALQPEWHIIIQILSLLSMIFGNFIAVTQTSMKRMLAYSSISQAGYLLIGILSGNNYGYGGMIIYLITYLFMNLGAFACIIIFGLRTGTDQIRDYTGLYYKDPWLAFCLSICLLSLAGIPPLAGFFGKLYLFWCGWETGLYLLVYVGLATSVVSIYYYLRVVKIMITRENKEQSIYIQNYVGTFSSLLINYSSLEIGIVLCVLASTILGFFLNPIILITNQTLLY